MLSIALTLASLALEKPGEKQWLIRRFKMYQDIMRDSEIYQMIVQEGVEKEAQRAAQEEIQNFRTIILNFIKHYFPGQESFAVTCIANITSQDVLKDVTFKLMQAPTEAEVHNLLAKAAKQARN